VITHIVLFRPLDGLSSDERAALIDALRAALRTIPSIRRARMGRRVTHGRPYEHSMRVNYEFAALLEFDDVAGLKAYLEHPAHDALATRFFKVADEALMYDFELAEGEQGLANLV
jgi:Stress responsive A/B Barrel Domain